MQLVNHRLKKAAPLLILLLISLSITLPFMSPSLSLRQANADTRANPPHFTAHFLQQNGHAAPLILKLNLQPGGGSTLTRASVLDSRLSVETPIPITPFFISVLAQEVSEQEKVFERWAPRPPEAVHPQCREKLKLALQRGKQKGEWAFCLDNPDQDPQARVALRWLNFVDESLRTQVHPRIRNEQKKR
jgi:hypothetical protein